MLAYRLRRWPNIVPTLDQHVVFSVSPYEKNIFNTENKSIIITDY